MFVVYGVVSEPCVREMVEGARRIAAASYGIALSGILGPGGGSDGKPVGLVHLAVAAPGGIETRQFNWPSERRLVKQGAAFAALNLLDKLLSPERREAPELLTSPKKNQAEMAQRQP